MSLLDTASLVVTPNGTKASKLYSVVPSSGAGDLDVTRATTATRVNSSGLIESVASNVPRLDYTNGSCPSILVEPQRTNLLNYSQDLTNASWEKTSIITLTPNTTETLSPSGINNATKITANGTDFLFTRQNVFGGVLTDTSNSLFVKKANNRYVGFRNCGGTCGHDVFDFDTETFTNNSGSTLSFDKLQNGWYRLKSSRTNSVLNFYFSIIVPNNTSGNEFDTVNNLSVYFWGAQAEIGAYATSYIPTTSASVTRNADTSTTSLSSSIINASEGVLFLDYQPLNIIDGFPIDFQLQYNGDNAVNGVTIYHIGGNPAITVRSGGSTIFSAILTATTVGTRNKIAIAYKNNDFAVYQNGVQKAVQTSGVAPALLNQFRLSDGNRHYSINSAAIWKTRLTNTQLAQLTTI
jgi:hypothetical protein